MSSSKSGFVVPENYAAIRVSMLVPDRVLEVEVFALINGRAVRWALAGEVLEGERIDRLLKHKVRKVLIRADDEKAFRDYIEKAVEDTLSSAETSDVQKVASAASATDMAAQDVLEKPEDKDTYLRSQEYFEKLGNLVASLPGGLSGILARPYVAESHDHMSHSLRVAAIAVGLATRLKLISKDADRTALVTAAYLHDAALEAKDISRSVVHSSQAPRDTIPGWRDHPLDGARIFQGKDFVNERVLDLIAQHEETPNGDGFPQGLTKAKMDPLAIVLSLANRFEDYFERHAGDTKAAVEECFTSELGRFELEQLTELKKIVTEALSGAHVAT